MIALFRISGHLPTCKRIYKGNKEKKTEPTSSYLSQLGSNEGKHTQVVHSKSPIPSCDTVHPRHLKQTLDVAATDAVQLLLGNAGCIMQGRPRATGNSLQRSGRNLTAIIKVQLLEGRAAQDFQQVRGPIGTFGVIVKAPAVIKKPHLCGCRPYYRLDGTKYKICCQPQKILA